MNLFRLLDNELLQKKNIPTLENMAIIT